MHWPFTTTGSKVVQQIFTGKGEYVCMYYMVEKNENEEVNATQRDMRDSEGEGKMIEGDEKQRTILGSSEAAILAIQFEETPMLFFLCCLSNLLFL